MVYNRCIGTRTCSNNCPYKVRRFNFLDNRSTGYATPDEVYNPQVTVRERGVMEKCTYCVQRIATARTQARVEDRGVRDGEVVTACQELSDAGDRLRRRERSGERGEPPRVAHTYAMLAELNTRPRTTRLARIESGAANEGLSVASEASTFTTPIAETPLSPRFGRSGGSRFWRQPLWWGSSA